MNPWLEGSAYAVWSFAFLQFFDPWYGVIAVPLGFVGLLLYVAALRRAD
jgi:hypothetical protein